MAKRSGLSATTAPSKKGKRQVTIATFQKWQTQFEREHATLSWLRCDRDSCDKSLVDCLWCDVCRKHEDRIVGMKNFSRAWITGCSNHKNSNIVDHATSEQHRAAMAIARTQAARASQVPLTSYSPIARGPLAMEESVEARIKRKFDICYVMAKESLAFQKYPALHQLEERHGVDLGCAYKTKDSAKALTHYIAESQHRSFIHNFPSGFYSFLMDGSTDTGNIENELVVIQYCVRDDTAQELRSCTRYLSLEIPTKADADGLISFLGNALKALGVQNLLDIGSVLSVGGNPVLVGGGTDGASVNVSEQNGMKGKLQKQLPWLFWTWCFAHCLELACKDALTSQLFKDLLEMLLRLFYLYAKSPKKSRELNDIVEDLREVWGFASGGNLPTRSHGTRWIAHKCKALQRVVDRYGAYINHLSTLAEDQSIRASDRARLKGILARRKLLFDLVPIKCFVGTSLVLWFSGALVFYQSYFILAHIALDMLHCLQNGVSPLYAASQEGHTDVVDILIKAGADIHQATTEVCIVISSGE